MSLPPAGHQFGDLLHPLDLDLGLWEIWDTSGGSSWKNKVPAAGEQVLFAVLETALCGRAMTPFSFLQPSV